MLSPRDILWKLVRRPYYALGYGRRFPGERALRRGVRSFEDRTGRGDAPMALATWNRDWEGGRWSALREEAERGRYEALTTILLPLGADARVLDVGCGDGALFAALEPHGVRRFVGIDLAAPAIVAARREFEFESAPALDRPQFEEADAALYQPAGSFDAIVFNEAIYYLEEPEAQALRYARHLAPAGLLVISTFRSPRADAIGRAVASTLVRRGGFAPPEQVVVRHPQRGTWRIRVYRRSDTGDRPPTSTTPDRGADSA